MKDMEQDNNTKGTNLTLDETTADSTRIGKAKIDKTVIAGARGESDRSSSANKSHRDTIAPPETAERTRIQKSERAMRDNSDRTRVASNSASNNADKTQFKPNLDKTKVAKPAIRKRNSPVKPTEQAKQPITESMPESGQDETMILKKRFILEKVLGAGGMGVVYKAKDMVKVEAGDKDPYVAIKVLTEEFKEHPDAFVALQRESRKTQRIAHPNIVNVHDFDKDKGTVFMTMEFLEGKPLDQLIRQYRSTGLPTDDALKIIDSVCQALIYAHGQKFIHSDFKPGNIFVTDRGVTKVFDFGIARAVARAEQYEDNPEDRTIFDAGDLGALTPAYASLEMLNGQEPDIRDDIYALGCVAYELFTGRHPFNKIPADEAKKQKLKPKRISHISRRQWKAIQKSLSFQREDRLASAEEFLSLMSKTKNSFKWPITIVLIGLLSAAGYYQYLGSTETSFDETEIRSELEFKLRIENFQTDIEVLIASSIFDESWENNLWKSVEDMQLLLNKGQLLLDSSTSSEFQELVENGVVWFSQSKAKIYSLYLAQIDASVKDGSLQAALGLIENARRYTEDFTELDGQKNRIQGLVAESKKAAEVERQAQLAQKERDREKALVTQKEQKQSQVKEQQYQEFSVALQNVNSQIRCETNRLDMRNLGTAIEKLKSIDLGRYQKIEREVITALTACITQIGKKFPERAAEFKTSALRIFNNSTQIAAIQIVPNDPCSPALAGLGARGKRAICKDTIKNIGSGPELVVIPAGRGIRLFAIGKYEVSNADFSLFCISTKSCQGVEALDKNLPVANLSLSLVEKYLQWLSDKTERVYRLPTLKEWEYAAKSTAIKLDPNRNCKLNTRGISKGDNFMRTRVGAQNAWGLVNYVGNASEWVYDNGKRLMSVGGAFNVPMDSCDIATKSPHTGESDRYSGFRVVRELSN